MPRTVFLLTVFLLVACESKGSNVEADASTDASACEIDPLHSGCSCDPSADPVPGCSRSDCIACENGCSGTVYDCDCDSDCDGGVISVSHCDPGGC